MDHELLAEGLGWAEGPTVLPDGRICFVESYRSQVSVWERGRGVSRYAYTAGGPNSCVLGDGRRDVRLPERRHGRAVARRGDVRRRRSSASSARAARRRSSPPSSTASASTGPTTSSSGRTGGSTSPTRAPTGRPTRSPPTCSCWTRDGTGRLLAELAPPTFPNGIAIEADGSVVWAESYTGMVRRLRLGTGAIEDIARLPGDKPIADGMAVGADGRLYVTTVNGGGIDVIAPDGTLRPVTSRPASIPTNCVFDGRDLIMTDAGVLADTADASYGGQLWRLPVDAEGLPTWPGRIG